MKFYNDEHKKYYEEFIKKDSTRNGDVERQAIFYLLALSSTTAANINSLYDFKDHSINFDGLSSGFQTSTSLALCKLAFNLYNGFDGCMGDGEKIKYMTPLDIFCYFDADMIDYIFYAIRLRLNLFK